MRVFCLAPGDIETCWGDFAVILQQLEHACQNMTADQVCAAVKNSTAQLWGLQDEERVHAIVVTEMQHTARGQVCVIVSAYGSPPTSDKRAVIDGLHDVVAAIEEWAREAGCVAMRVIGRKGWRRWDRRFQKTAEVLECPL